MMIETRGLRSAETGRVVGGGENKGVDEVMEWWWLAGDESVKG